MDLGVGQWGAQLVDQVKQWRRKWKNVEPFGAYEFTPPLPNGEDALVAELGAEPLADTDDFLTFIRARMTTIARNAEAKSVLAKHWPTDVPSPKNGLTELEHIERVMKLLDDVEAEFGLGWPEGDPRASVPVTTRSR